MVVFLVHDADIYLGFDCDISDPPFVAIDRLTGIDKVGMESEERENGMTIFLVGLFYSWF